MTEQHFEKITVIDSALAQIYPVGPNGLSPEDIEDFKQQIPHMRAGQIDTVSLVPVHGLLVTDELQELVNSQLTQVIESANYKKTPSLRRKGGGYTQLHVDGVQDIDGNQVTVPGVRTHFTQGSSLREGNLPNGYSKSDFDPYFVIGRIDSYETGPNGSTLSYGDFHPVVAIDVQSPVWTIFRNSGNRHGENPPLAHSVVPRKVLEAILEPSTIWSELDSLSSQTAAYKGKSLTINADNYAMLAGVDSPIGSPDREFTGTDYVDLSVTLNPR